jgi:2,4-dienoyl-CoA reductase-like NADH-dependent reductase (Old Yellow Enzyme family)
MKNEALKHLFTPVEIGPIKLPNRIFVTPHSTNFVSDSHDNLLGERFAYYCAERAKGGVGLIEVSMAMIGSDVDSYAPTTDAQFSPLFGGLPESLSGNWPIRGGDPKVVEGYTRLAKMVHAFGAKCFIEVSAGGYNFGNEQGVSRFTTPSITGVSPLLPFTSRELDERGIEAAVEGFGRAAKYIGDSGLDGIDSPRRPRCTDSGISFSRNESSKRQIWWFDRKPDEISLPSH